MKIKITVFIMIVLTLKSLVSYGAAKNEANPDEDCKKETIAPRFSVLQSKEHHAVPTKTSIQNPYQEELENFKNRLKILRDFRIEYGENQDINNLSENEINALIGLYEELKIFNESSETLNPEQLRKMLKIMKDINTICEKRQFQNNAYDTITTEKAQSAIQLHSYGTPSFSGSGKDTLDDSPIPHIKAQNMSQRKDTQKEKIKETLSEELIRSKGIIDPTNRRTFQVLIDSFIYALLMDYSSAIPLSKLISLGIILREHRLDPDSNDNVQRLCWEVKYILYELQKKQNKKTKKKKSYSKLQIYIDSLSLLLSILEESFQDTQSDQIKRKFKADFSGFDNPGEESLIRFLLTIQADGNSVGAPVKGTVGAARDYWLVTTDTAKVLHQIKTGIVAGIEFGFQGLEGRIKATMHGSTFLGIIHGKLYSSVNDFVEDCWQRPEIAAHSNNLQKLLRNMMQLASLDKRYRVKKLLNYTKQLKDNIVALGFVEKSVCFDITWIDHPEKRPHPLEIVREVIEVQGGVGAGVIPIKENVGFSAAADARYLLWNNKYILRKHISEYLSCHPEGFSHFLSDDAVMNIGNHGKLPDRIEHLIKFHFPNDDIIGKHGCFSTVKILRRLSIISSLYTKPVVEYIPEKRSNKSLPKPTPKEKKKTIKVPHISNEILRSVRNLYIDLMIINFEQFKAIKENYACNIKHEQIKKYLKRRKSYNLGELQHHMFATFLLLIEQYLSLHESQHKCILPREIQQMLETMASNYFSLSDKTYKSHMSFYVNPNDVSWRDIQTRVDFPALESLSAFVMDVGYEKKDLPDLILRQIRKNYPDYSISDKEDYLCIKGLLRKLAHIVSLEKPSEVTTHTTDTRNDDTRIPTPPMASGRGFVKTHKMYFPSEFSPTQSEDQQTGISKEPHTKTPANQHSPSGVLDAIRNFHMQLIRDNFSQFKSVLTNITTSVEKRSKLDTRPTVTPDEITEAKKLNIQLQDSIFSRTKLKNQLDIHLQEIKKLLKCRQAQNLAELQHHMFATLLLIAKQYQLLGESDNLPEEIEKIFETMASNYFNLPDEKYKGYMSHYVKSGDTSWRKIWPRVDFSALERLGGCVMNIGYREDSIPPYILILLTDYFPDDAISDQDGYICIKKLLKKLSYIVYLQKSPEFIADIDSTQFTVAPLVTLKEKPQIIKKPDQPKRRRALPKKTYSTGRMVKPKYNSSLDESNKHNILTAENEKKKKEDEQKKNKSTIQKGSAISDPTILDTTISEISYFYKKLIKDNFEEFTSVRTEHQLNTKSPSVKKLLKSRNASNLGELQHNMLLTMHWLLRQYQSLGGESIPKDINDMLKIMSENYFNLSDDEYNRYMMVPYTGIGKTVWKDAILRFQFLTFEVLADIRFIHDEGHCNPDSDGNYLLIILRFTTTVDSDTTTGNFIDGKALHETLLNLLKRNIDSSIDILFDRGVADGVAGQVSGHFKREYYFVETENNGKKRYEQQYRRDYIGHEVAGRIGKTLSSLSDYIGFGLKGSATKLTYHPIPNREVWGTHTFTYIAGLHNGMTIGDRKKDWHKLTRNPEHQMQLAQLILNTFKPTDNARAELISLLETIHPGMDDIVWESELESPIDMVAAARKHDLNEGKTKANGDDVLFLPTAESDNPPESGPMIDYRDFPYIDEDSDDLEVNSECDSALGKYSEDFSEIDSMTDDASEVGSEHDSVLEYAEIPAFIWIDSFRQLAQAHASLKKRYPANKVLQELIKYTAFENALNSFNELLEMIHEYYSRSLYRHFHPPCLYKPLPYGTQAPHADTADSYNMKIHSQ